MQVIQTPNDEADRSWISILLALGLALGGAQVAEAQCAVISTTDVQPGAPAFIVKVLSGNPGACSTTGSLNVGFCGSGTVPMGQYGCTQANCRTIYAYVTNPTGGTAHNCSFNCGGCPTIQIDNSDGLPVELMDFEIVPDTPADAEAEESPSR